MSSSTTQTTTNRWQLRELNSATNRILNDNSLHFILMSLLFLPATFSAYTAVKFYFSSPPGTDVTTMFDPFNLFLIKTTVTSLTIKTLIIIFAFALFVILPTGAGVALITYSANQAIQRKPLTFSSTLKSLSRSYIRLLHTIISGLLTLVIIFLVFTLSPIVAIEAIKALGFHFRVLYVSIFVNFIIPFALALATIFCMGIWGSAAAITVLESKAGFETLRQSAKQSKEFRGHSFYIVFNSGFILGVALLYMSTHQIYGPKANWTLILHVGIVYLGTSLMILHYVVANTVLYVQGKVVSWEEIVKTAEEGAVSGEYVRVVVNDRDGELLHELAKEEANGGFSYLVSLLSIVWLFILPCVELYQLFAIHK